jgi:hypothetical protein
MTMAVVAVMMMMSEMARRRGIIVLEARHGQIARDRARPAGSVLHQVWRGPLALPPGDSLPGPAARSLLRIHMLARERVCVAALIWGPAGGSCMTLPLSNSDAVGDGGGAHPQPRHRRRHLHEKRLAAS